MDLIKLVYNQTHLHTNTQLSTPVPLHTSTLPPLHWLCSNLTLPSPPEIPVRNNLICPAPSPPKKKTENNNILCSLLSQQIEITGNNCKLYSGHFPPPPPKKVPHLLFPNIVTQSVYMSRFFIFYRLTNCNFVVVVVEIFN